MRAGETKEKALHTELEENSHDRAEGEKYHVEGIQENGKEQDEVESTTERPMSVPLRNEEDKKTQKKRNDIFSVHYMQFCIKDFEVTSTNKVKVPFSPKITNR